MALTQQEKTTLERNLDKCDAALAGKPTLSSIYESTWRLEFRQSTLQANSMNEVSYPSTYAVPIFADSGLFPKCYQYRLEEGARIFLPKLSNIERGHLTTRMRGNGCLSAEEEILLVRGFALEFGKDAILTPMDSIDVHRPEFIINFNEHQIDIEAKGLLDSDRVRMLNETARKMGQNYWTADESINDISRVRSVIIRKITEVNETRPVIIVFTQYSAWPDVRDVIFLLRDMALNPSKCDYGIPQTKVPLAIAYVFQRLIQGIWFNLSVADNCGVSADFMGKLRQSTKNSFYPRQDSLIFTEMVDDNIMKL